MIGYTEGTWSLERSRMLCLSMCACQQHTCCYTHLWTNYQTCMCYYNWCICCNPTDTFKQVIVYCTLTLWRLHFHLSGCNLAGLEHVCEGRFSRLGLCNPSVSKGLKDLPLIFDSDANAHNIIRGRSDFNLRGSYLVENLSSTDLELLIGNHQTFIVSARDKMLDITLPGLPTGMSLLIWLWSNFMDTMDWLSKWFRWCR